MQNRNRPTDLENKPKVARGTKGRKRSFGSWMTMCTLLYLKWITNKVLHIAQGTLLNVMWQPKRGGEFVGEGIHAYVGLIHAYESLCCPPEAMTTLLASYTST